MISKLKNFKFGFYLFFFLAFLLSFFVSGVIDSTDGFQYLAVARNIYYGKGPIAPPYEYGTRENIHMSVITGKDGKTYSLTGLGFSLAYVPAIAITDLVYKYFGVSPPVHFPLENDWLISLTASFTNIFFAAGLSVVLFLYFKELKIKTRNALLFTFISLFATNLFPYAKHSFAHMMFTFFLVLSFFFLKKYSSDRNKKIFMFFSGISYGIVIITYNQTFSLSVIPYILYYLFFTKPKFNKESLKNIIIDLFIFVLGTTPFLFTYFWFENLRSSAETNFGSAQFFIGRAGKSFLVPPSIFFEGVFGQLFSPGRSFFIYSPILLIPILFWSKIKKGIKPEVIVFASISFIYIIFYATQFSEAPGQGITALWHGESSWGPRYLVPLIPFGILLTAKIYGFLSKKQKLFIFLPLVIIGLYIELLGIILPYQIKFNNLLNKFTINETIYTVYFYSNIFPRYSPIITMSKNLIKTASSFPKTFERGEFNVRFYDGFDFPFNVGLERWRTIEGEGYLSFDNNSSDPIKEIQFDIINHPLTESKQTAVVNVYLNDKKLLKNPFVVKITERKNLIIPLKDEVILPKNNNLVIKVDYSDKTILSENKQLLGLITLKINGKEINKETIDVPYISPLGPKMTGAVYKNWGGTNKDLWKTWDIHTQTFERIPDFWWIRNLYYWDIPQKWIYSILAFNITALIFLGIKLFSSFRKLVE